MHFYVSMNRFSVMNVLMNSNLHTTEDIDDIFVLFRSPDHLEKSKNYLSSKYRNIRFICEKEQNNSMSFLPEPAMVSKNLCITNPHLAEYIQISTVSFPNNIKLVCFSLYYFERFHLFRIFQDFIQKYVI